MNDVNVKFYIDKSIRAFFVNQILSIKKFFKINGKRFQIQIIMLHYFYKV